MQVEPDDELIAFLSESGIIRSRDDAVFSPLDGGVASDIWTVKTSTRTICVKRALAKLKVEKPWFAPVERNIYEVQWLRQANAVVPGVTPEILAEDMQRGMFAMSYLPPDDYPVWKARLRDGHADPAFAARVGDCLGRIHAATANDEGIERRFDTAAIFYDIRLEPYLLATAQNHADRAEQLHALVAATQDNAKVLVHGDVSPKNILVSPDARPIFLDAECACYGDPAFDLAFCLNQLLLKCIWTPSATEDFLTCFDSMTQAYLAHVNWEPVAEMQSRAAQLLPGLMLGRIDGRSPAEYITTDAERDRVREFARALLLAPVHLLAQISSQWAQVLKRK
jgi:5-methylthioribose kinase